MLMPRYDFAHVQGDVNPQILRMFKGTFSIDEALILYVSYGKYHIRCISYL